MPHIKNISSSWLFLSYFFSLHLIKYHMKVIELCLICFLRFASINISFIYFPLILSICIPIIHNKISLIKKSFWQSFKFLTYMVLYLNLLLFALIIFALFFLSNRFHTKAIGYKNKGKLAFILYRVYLFPLTLSRGCIL